MESANQQSCFDCTLRPDRIFCDLPSEALEAFDHIKELWVPHRGTVLFEEGRPPRGVYVLCDGRVKLSVCSEKGKRLTMRIAGPGEVLGLSACLSGTPYEVTAETLDDARVTFIRRKELLKFLREHREACMQVVHLLSEDLHTAYSRVRAVGMVRTRRSALAHAH